MLSRGEMKFTYTTSFIDSDEMKAEILYPCEHCGRTFFASSLMKHQVYCANQKITRQNAHGDCANYQSSRQEYKVSTMSSMLSIGRKRRQRWRHRHEEFLQTIRGLKTSVSTASAQEVAGTYKTRSLDQLDLKQCSYCGRSFNETSFVKHVTHCEELSLRMKSIGSEQNKKNEALDRFKARMKYRPVPVPSRSENGTMSQVSDIHSSDFTNSFISYPSPTSSISITDGSDSSNGINEVYDIYSPNQIWSCPPINTENYSPWNVVLQASNCNHIQSRASPPLLERQSVSLPACSKTPVAKVLNLNDNDKSIPQSWVVDEPEQDPYAPINCSSPSTASSLSTISLFVTSLNPEHNSGETAQKMETIGHDPLAQSHHPWSPTVSSFACRSFECNPTPNTARPSQNFGYKCIEPTEQSEHSQRVSSVESESPIIFNSTQSLKCTTFPSWSRNVPSSVTQVHLHNLVPECLDKPLDELRCSSELINPTRCRPLEDRKHSLTQCSSTDVTQSSRCCPYRHTHRSHRRRICRRSHRKASRKLTKEKKHESPIYFICHPRSQNQQIGETQLVRLPISQTVSSRSNSRAFGCSPQNAASDENLARMSKLSQSECQELRESPESLMMNSKDSTEVESSYLPIGKSGDLFTVSSGPEICWTEPEEIYALPSSKSERREMNEPCKQGDSKLPITNVGRLKSSTKALDLLLTTYRPGAPTTMVLTKTMLHRRRSTFLDNLTDDAKCYKQTSVKSHESPKTLLVDVGTMTETMLLTTCDDMQSAFCYECGRRYVDKRAKYCSYCGTMRIWDSMDSETTRNQTSSCNYRRKRYCNDQLTSMWTQFGYPSIGNSCSFQ